MVSLLFLFVSVSVSVSLFLSLIPNTSYTIIIIFFPLSVSVLSYLCCIPYKVRSRFAVSSISIYNLFFFFSSPPSPFPHLPRSRAKDLRANSSPFKLPLTKKKKKDNSSTSCNQTNDDFLNYIYHIDKFIFLKNISLSFFFFYLSYLISFLSLSLSVFLLLWYKKKLYCLGNLFTSFFFFVAPCTVSLL